MDINETRRGMINRHPWELSRTQMLIKEWKRFINNLYRGDGQYFKYVNVGAGDLYFDDLLMNTYNNVEVYAVDIGYDTQGKREISKKNKHLTNDINSIDENVLFDFSVMMDSLEYMQDDREYISKLMLRVRRGGYMFFTIPAYTSLFSDHDVHVGNLRRYNRKDIEKLFSDIDGLEIVYSRHFYFSLYLVRLFQVLTKIKIDPEQKVTTGWKFKEDGWITRVVKGVLNFDYLIGRYLPGLSLMIVCVRK